MKINNISFVFRYLSLLPLLLLGGCNMDNFWILNPKGIITKVETHYLVLDVVVLSIIILPTLLLLFLVMWRYRRSAQAAYTPKWSHSNTIEIVVWGIPLIIVIVLSYFSWQGTRAVDPWHPKIISNQVDAKPLRVDVYTTDWQWLFVYPQQNLAISNELVVPVNRVVKFDLTSVSVTNDFFIPNLVGQIYIMPGMRTKQSMVANHVGQYEAFSAEFSGPGFADMNYKVKVLLRRKFDRWVATAKKRAKNSLSYTEFARFAKPTINVAHRVEYFTNIQSDLFRQVVTNVRNGKLHFQTPLFLTENMDGALFKQHVN